MTFSPWRPIVDELTHAVQASALPNVDQWKFHAEEPIYHAADAKHCAVWFDSFAIAEENGTTGDLEYVAAFGIRYWEPAPERASGLVVDEEAMAEIEAILEGLCAVIADNEGGLGTSYETWLMGGGKFRLDEGGAAIRGCEIAVRARMRRALT